MKEWLALIPSLRSWITIQNHNFQISLKDDILLSTITPTSVFIEYIQNYSISLLGLILKVMIII